ncbi:uncharacterized protein LOC110982696 [Acanthaster planci]|uniref:Uncharacterized protein LOC110982696 n=1 Tax=Acanthaster planci TaxID=133434 RepID=A0A8B7YWD6_ACAPL|nr:uncharacterized protein LOC110982696 [Acanthaster planci]XP_022097003.1 uncharacterized protein LOC110982696 [Acanthaster planci]XP_022097004.1 uncharacterized protein LOC110982696 [Acanthaster planci]
MDNLFERGSASEGYLETVVHDISRGSIVITFESIYTENTNADIPFKEVFREKLEERALIGNLGQFSFVPATLVVFDVCNLYCFNGGTVNRAIDVCSCSCPEGFLLPECQAPTTTVITTKPATTMKLSSTSGIPTTETPTPTREAAKTPRPTPSSRSQTTIQVIPTTAYLETSRVIDTTRQLPSTTKDIPTTTQMTTAMDTSTEEDLPTTQDVTTMSELPTTANISTTTGLLTTTEIPTTTELPTTTDIPTTTKLPSITETPMTTESLTTTEIPTTTELPTTTEIPTTELPTTPMPLLHCHRFSYANNYLRLEQFRGGWTRQMDRHIHHFPYPRLLYCLFYIDEPPVASTNGFVCPDNDTLLYFSNCLDYHFDRRASNCKPNSSQVISCPSLEDLYNQLNDTFGTEDPPTPSIHELFEFVTFRECLALGEDDNRTLSDGFYCPPATEIQETAQCLDYHLGSVSLDGQPFSGNASAVCDSPPSVCPSFGTLIFELTFDFGPDGGCGCASRRKRRQIDWSSFSYSFSSSGSFFDNVYASRGVQLGRQGCYNGFPYPRLLYCEATPDSPLCPASGYTDAMLLCFGYHFEAPDFDGPPISPDDCPCFDVFIEMLETAYGREEPPDCVCNDPRNFVSNNTGDSLAGMPVMDRCGFVSDFPFPLLTHCLIELESNLLPGGTDMPYVCPEPEVIIYYDTCLHVYFDNRNPPRGWNGTCPCANELYQELFDTFGYGRPPNFANELNRGCVCFSNESYDGQKFDDLEFAAKRYEACEDDPLTTFNNGSFACPGTSQLETFNGCLEFYFGNYKAPNDTVCPPQDEFVNVLVDVFRGYDGISGGQHATGNECSNGD